MRVSDLLRHRLHNVGSYLGVHIIANEALPLHSAERVAPHA